MGKDYISSQKGATRTSPLLTCKRNDFRGSLRSLQMKCDGRSCNACSGPWDEDCSEQEFPSSFRVSKSMVRVAKFFRVTFQVRARGEVEGEGERELWCLDFRKNEMGSEDKEGAPFFVINTKKEQNAEAETTVAGDL